MTGNRITTIESNAFNLTPNSDLSLYIDLSDNVGLTGDSFQDSSLITNRDTELILKSNLDLKYLKQSVFQPFFDNAKFNINSIDLAMSPLDYYQDNRWLLENETKLKLTYRIYYAKMVDGVDLWESDPNKFTKIRQNVSTIYND